MHDALGRAHQRGKRSDSPRFNLQIDWKRYAMIHGGGEGVLIFRTVDRNQCLEYALVLESVGITHEMKAAGDEWILAVLVGEAERSCAELDAYVLENARTPEELDTIRPKRGGWAGAGVYAAILLVVDWLQQTRFFGADWWEAGKTRAALIRQGDWWRTLTALTLHGDGAHLVANLVVGSLVGVLVSQVLGSGLGWLSILIVGAWGNGLNAFIRSPDHSSIGASTAIFGGLGILAALAARRRRSGASVMQRWTPLVGGVLLLSFLGTGGERTDVTAHVCGFFCGMLWGAGLGTWGDRLASHRSLQWVCALAAIILLIWAWMCALSVPNAHSARLSLERFPF